MAQDQWDGLTERRGEGRGVNLFDVMGKVGSLSQAVQNLTEELRKDRETAEVQRVEDRKANKEEHEALRVEVRKLKDAVYNPREGLFADNSRQQAEIQSLKDQLTGVLRQKEKDSDSRTRFWIAVIGSLVTAFLLAIAGYTLKGIMTGG